MDGFEFAIGLLQGCIQLLLDALQVQSGEIFHSGQLLLFLDEVLVEDVAALLEGIVEGDLILLATVGIYDGGQVDILEAALTRPIPLPARLHPTAIFGIPALLARAAHLLIVEQRADLFGALVLLLGDDALTFLGHGKLDHLQVPTQNAVDGRQLGLAAQHGAFLMGLGELLDLVLAETLDLAVLVLGEAGVGDDGVVFLL